MEANLNISQKPTSFKNEVGFLIWPYASLKTVLFVCRQIFLSVCDPVRTKYSVWRTEKLQRSTVLPLSPLCHWRYDAVCPGVGRILRTERAGCIGCCGGLRLRGLSLYVFIPVRRVSLSIRQPYRDDERISFCRSVIVLSWDVRRGFWWGLHPVISFWRYRMKYQTSIDSSLWFSLRAFWFSFLCMPYAGHLPA